ncbi:MAG TPA: hypothetical protein VFU14_18110 [Acidimicrobiales bacterium]|nr:hypothetical protein [Acidimicrobiales bacterium]
MAVATAASLVVRVLLARTVVSPFIFQDEGGYVGVARLLAGDAPTLYGPTYLPGYGVLLAPAAAVLGPSGLQNAAQVLNAAAAAAVIPVLHLLGLRFAGLRPWLSAGVAVVGGTMAASVVQATMLLPEALLVLVVAVGVLALHHALQRPSPGWAAAAGVVVGAGYAVHPRAIVGVVAVLVVAAAAWRLGALPRRTAAVLAAAAVGTTVATQVLHAWATAQLYPSGTKPSLAGSPLGALGEPVGAAVITAGQTWYVVAASLGLVPLGLVAAARTGWLERTGARGLTAGFVVLGALGSLALGTIGSYDVGTGTDVTRADLPLYGRYLEQWVPVLVVLAPALVRRWVWPVAASVAAGVAAAAFAIHAMYPTATWRQPVAWHNIASLQVPVDVFGRDHVRATGLVVALAVLGVGAVASRADRRWWLVPLGAVVAMNLVGGVALVRDWAGPSSEAWAARHRLGPVLAAADEVVWVDLDDDFDIFWAYNVQFWHPDVEVAYFDEAPPGGAALVLGTEAQPPVPGASLVATERDGDLGLWSLPSP